MCKLWEFNFQIKVLLCKQWNMPESAACKTCDTFLEHFRKCPDDCLNELDEWRTFLWTSALNQDYKHLAAEVHERWKRIRGRHFTFQSQVVILLQTLRQHYKIALITNGPSHAQWEKIAHLEAVELFDTIIVSGDLAYEKPQPEIFHLACRRLQVRPDKCAMVGDRFETDIIGSQLAGLAASIWIPLNSNSNSQEVSSSSSPVVTISQLGELSSLFDIFKTDSKESIHPV